MLTQHEFNFEMQTAPRTEALIEELTIETDKAGNLGYLIETLMITGDRQVSLNKRGIIGETTGRQVAYPQGISVKGISPPQLHIISSEALIIALGTGYAKLEVNGTVSVTKRGRTTTLRTEKPRCIL